ncbi:ankyrin repeat domain-containing protein [Pseudorhizobium halotolerans]|uniref:Ankyrin repeat domain-containing protein n=2 Tax=Pseudorhizobium halotolerans TaxID=1233081 RepID=A0ABN7K0Z2_9HYPH|nr:ankyrin repeat domain-containing protein [Rhizobium sp. Khangiran2]CAD7057371.1 ankyrin repeat domain-containing protein [Pseudorhizobium halotolerans]
MTGRRSRALAALMVILALAWMATATPGQQEAATPLMSKTSAELSASLQEALTAENLAEVEALLAAGADPNWIDPGGKTAVHRAAFADDPRLLDVVLAHGGDPNARGLAGTTPLVDAILARSHPLEKIERLLAAGADPGLADPNGGTPLHTAARTNNGKAILILLNAGASPLAETGGKTFQTFYFGYQRSVLNDRALTERHEVIDWLRQNGIPLEPQAVAE